MLQVIVRLKEGVASKELDKNTSYTPDVARETPAHVENDLRRTVMSCRNNRRVIFVIERGGTKVNQSNFGTEQYSAEFCRSRRGF